MSAPPTNPAMDPSPSDPRRLRSRSALRRRLAELTAREAELEHELDALVGTGSGKETIRRAGEGLSALIPRVQKLLSQVDGHDGPIDGLDEFDAEHERLGLLHRVSGVHEVSERVGTKVRKLDAEVGRVTEGAERVGEVLELKLSLQSLRDAIAAQDWEQAARSCAQAQAVPEAALHSGFAARVVPSPVDPSPPDVALPTLREQLLSSFAHEFKAAAAQKDEQGTSRFFRLFPTVGAEEEGLAVYSDFVVGLVKKPTTKATALSHIAHLTSLLESIALIIDQHQPVVEKYYGSGRMVRVLQRLQSEADRTVRSLVEAWEEERRVGRLIADARKTPFTYLKDPLRGTAPSNAPSAVNALSALSHAQQSAIGAAATSLLATYAGGGHKASSAQAAPSATPAAEEAEPEGPDLRDVDRALGEMVALSGRWALYRRFVWNRLVDEDDDEAEAEEGVDEQDAVRRDESRGEASNVLSTLDTSDSQRAVEHMLRTYYEPLEAWYLRVSVEKAHQLDVPDLSSRPYLSSVVDDVFYLLKLVLHRAFSTGSLGSLQHVREATAAIIERDYLGVLQKKMDAVYSGGSISLPLPSLPGQNREAERERKERDLRTSYSVFLNDLETSAAYMDRLIEDLQGDTIATSWLERDLPAVHDQALQFRQLAARMRTMAKHGIEQIFNQLTRPRLRSLLEDAYKGVSYLLDEDGYHAAEEDDLVRKRFITGWDPLMAGYKATLTDGNFQQFFSTTVEVLVRPWERMVAGMRFTELGAIRFDRDVRAVVNYLSTQSDFGGARDKFTRLQQIATVLNLDASEDVDEFYSVSGIPWRLSRVEYNEVAALRA